MHLFGTFVPTSPKLPFMGGFGASGALVTVCPESLALVGSKSVIRKFMTCCQLWVEVLSKSES